MKNKQQRVFTIEYRRPGDKKNRMATSHVKRTGDIRFDMKQAEGYVMKEWPDAIIMFCREGHHPLS